MRREITVTQRHVEFLASGEGDYLLPSSEDDHTGEDLN